MNKEILNTFLNTVSVSGNEEPNLENAKFFASEFAEKIIEDKTGNMIAVVNPDSDTKVLLCAHIDEIGFRVSYIQADGFIRIQSAGNVHPTLYVGAPIQIIHETVSEEGCVRTKVNGVVAVNKALFGKDVSDTDLLIDIGASTREEAEAVVAVGDSVCADTVVRELLNDRLTCRALDDKTGVFVVLEAAKEAAKNGAECGIYAAATVGEETTLRGAYFAGAGIKPDCAVIVDVTYASDYPGTDPGECGDISVGGGPVLMLSGAVSKKLNQRMERVANRLGITLQYELSGGRTRTDGDMVLMTGEGVPLVLVSIPLRYMHSSAEVGSWKDLEECIELIAGFITDYEKE